MEHRLVNIFIFWKSIDRYSSYMASKSRRVGRRWYYIASVSRCARAAGMSLFRF